MTEPSLTLTFTANDLPYGHSTTQVLNDYDLVRDSFEFKRSRLNGLKSSSDTVNLQIRKGCASVEDIIATEGNIQAVLSDGETILYTGFIATSYSWGVTDHGEQALNVTIESMGTRLFNKPFIETGKHFFDCTASAAIYSIVTPLGIIFRPGEERKLLQPVRRTAEAGETCRELLDSLFYECNAVYYFNELGQLCVQPIDANTENAPTYDKEKLRMVDRKVVSLSKKLRTYSGARVAYTELASADNYLVYRNTTGQDSSHPYCNLELQAGEYFDGTEIYTAQEWSEAQADTFREPALIGAVNAASESQIVGSNKIVSIDNLAPEVVGAGMTCEFENVGGGYFKLTAHNGSGGARSFFRMDLYASIIYVKSNGVIRTQIDGPSAGKSTLEESLTWIHDRDNATKHANLLAQYHRYASATYTFYTNENIPLGSVVKLYDNVFSGLEVYVLVTASQKHDNSSTIAYSAVGVSTFNLDQDAYHGISEPARQSGQQGPPGAPGEAAEVQYALGTSLTEPPSAEMQWGGEDMLWNGEQMIWNDGLYTDDIPALVRGMYVWMRSRVGEQPWQYTRLTGATAWEAENLGIAMTETPKTSRQGLNLTVGDYFVCGALFTEDEKTYQPGYAYIYTGSAWTEMSLADEANAEKAIDLLSSLVSAEIQIPSSNSAYSVWQWTKNLVALNAVIQNLTAMNLKVGTHGTGFSFRALTDDGNGNKVFDVTYNGADLFKVDIATGKIYFGQGFWYNPDDGAIHSSGDKVVIGSSGTITAIDAEISGSSRFHGSFNCDVIKTVVGSPSLLTTLSTSVNDYTQIADLLYTWRDVAGLSVDTFYRVNLVGYPSVRYAKITPSVSYGESAFYFYDEQYNAINPSSLFSVSSYNTSSTSYLNTRYGSNYRRIGGTWAVSGFTLQILTGGNVLEVSIPSAGQASGLSSNQLFYGAQTTVGGVSCFPVYMKA